MPEQIGYVVHYKHERDGGAYVPGKACSPALLTAEAMMRTNPYRTVVIEPVTEIPEWVDNA